MAELAEIESRALQVLENKFSQLCKLGFGNAKIRVSNWKCEKHGDNFRRTRYKKSPIFEGFILRAMSSFSIPPVFALRSLSVFDHLNSRSVADQLQRLFNNKPYPCLVLPKYCIFSFHYISKWPNWEF